MIIDTPNINEDQIMDWPVQRFLTRLQYLSDIWSARKHDANIANNANS